MFLLRVALQCIVLYWFALYCVVCSFVSWFMLYDMYILYIWYCTYCTYCTLLLYWTTYVRTLYVELCCVVMNCYDLCCVVLCCAVLCCVVLCCVVLSCTVLCLLPCVVWNWVCCLRPAPHDPLTTVLSLHYCLPRNWRKYAKATILYWAMQSRGYVQSIRWVCVCVY